MNRRAMMALENNNEKKAKEELMAIDKQLFIDTFTEEFIESVTVNKEDSLKYLLDKNNHPVYVLNKYYHNLKDYANRAQDARFNNVLDLYPPNVVALYYIIEHLDEFKGKTWLDFGCGIGMLGVYLNYLGIEFYGYDNFSQGVPKDAAINFLRKYKLEDRLIDSKDIYNYKWNCISSFGIWNEINFSKVESLQYVFDDVKYQATNNGSLQSLGFKRIQTESVVESMLVIYRKG